MSHIAYFEFLDRLDDEGLARRMYSHRQLQLAFGLPKEKAGAIHAGWIATCDERELPAAERVKIYLSLVEDAPC